MPSFTLFRKDPSRHRKRFTRLVNRVVLPRLGIEDPESVSHLDRITEGHATSKHIRMLEIPGEPSRVIRAFFRWYKPVRPGGGRFIRFDQACRFGMQLREAGFPTPEVFAVYRGTDWKTFTQYWIAVEEFIEGGRQLCRQDRDQICTAFRLLGKLHSQRSTTWGRDKYPPKSFPASSVGKRLSRLARKLPNCPLRKKRAPLAAWGEEEARRIQGSMPGKLFSLIHGDYKNTNLLYRENSLWMIDFLHTRYSLAGFEFLNALVHFCRENGFAADAASAYFEVLEEDLHPQYLIGESLLLAMTSIYQIGKGIATCPAGQDLNLDRIEAWKPGLMAKGARSNWEEVLQAVLESRMFRGDLGTQTEPKEAPAAP